MAMGIIEVGEHYMYSKYSIALVIIVVGMAWGKPRGCVHIKVSIINKEYLIWSCCTEYTPHTGNMNILYSVQYMWTAVPYTDILFPASPPCVHRRIIRQRSSLLFGGRT